MAQTVKRLPAMRETQVQSLGGEEPLEKAMATHSSTLAWKIPWTEEPGLTKSRTRLSDFTFTFHFFKDEYGDYVSSNFWRKYKGFFVFSNFVLVRNSSPSVIIIYNSKFQSSFVTCLIGRHRRNCLFSCCALVIFLLLAISLVWFPSKMDLNGPKIVYVEFSVVAVSLFCTGDKIVTVLISMVINNAIISGVYGYPKQSSQIPILLKAVCNFMKNPSQSELTIGDMLSLTREGKAFFSLSLLSSAVI